MENRIRKPTHPGELIREDLLPETGMSQAQLARVFNSTPEMWLNMQQAVDLWEARSIHGHEYAKIHPVQVAISL